MHAMLVPIDVYAGNELIHAGSNAERILRQTRFQPGRIVALGHGVHRLRHRVMRSAQDSEIFSFRDMSIPNYP